MSRGFTLIEILVVLTIIGIVTAIGVTATNRLRQEATTHMLEARLKQLNIAKGQFIAEWGRIEAELTWADPDRDGNTAETTAQDRYHLLKRYINRPPSTLAEYTPRDCTINTPSSVHALYSGTDSTSDTITDSN
jgi:prepilin-type N-terminal cleavage/methylation domain-containing protein